MLFLSEGLCCINGVSVARLLLGVEAVQTKVALSLIEKLIEYGEDVPVVKYVDE